MRKLTYTLLLFLLSQLLLSQFNNPKKLNEKISILNNELKYDQSILLLEEIINNSTSKPYDIYNAYLLKALTYKRLYNYSEVLRNLDLAYEWGLKSPNIKEVTGKIKIEKLFLHFDMLKFDEVEKFLPQISQAEVQSVDLQTQAFYKSLVAVMDMRNNRFEEAEKKLDESIEILKTHSPKDLPNIYRKKISLYSNLNEEDQAIESYELGLKYAEKYNIGVYKFAINEAMSDFYLKREDYKKAFYYHDLKTQIFNEYNVSEENDKLKILERDLLNNRKEIELQYEKKKLCFLIVILVILFAFLLVLFKLLKVNKQKNLYITRENQRMREELEKISKATNEKGESKLDVNQYNLTPRQVEIIKLVKQGKTNKEIGAELFISENTVKYHLKIIYNALGIENRWDLKQ